MQRELLLDTMVQNTPVAMVLLDPSHARRARQYRRAQTLGEGKRLEGQAFEEMLARSPEALREAFERGGDGIFAVGDDDDEDIFHLSRRSFRLNGRRHELMLLRQLTAELRRQEVQTWKKVIRVISHELNNSLAPIASLAHSSAELLRRGQLERLPMTLVDDRRSRAASGRLHPRLRALREVAGAASGTAGMVALSRAIAQSGRIRRGTGSYGDGVIRCRCGADASSRC